MRGYTPIEAPGLEHSFVEITEIVGVGLLNQIPHQRIVCRPLIPFHVRVGGQQRLGDARHNGKLTFQVI